MLFTYKKELVINYLYYSMGFILPGLLSFLLIPLILRNFGAEIYAQYSIAFNTLSVISMFCYGWIGHSYIRFYSTGEIQLNKLSSKLILRSLLVGFLILSVLIFFVTKITLLDFVFVVPAFFLSGYYSFRLMILQAKQQAKKIAVSEIIRTSVNLGIPLIYSLFFQNAIKVLPLLLITLSCSYLLPLLFFLKDKTPAHDGINPNSISLSDLSKQFTNYGIPVAFFLSLALALTVNDRFIIAKILGDKMAGNYAAVYDILNKGVGFICAPVVMTFYPHIVKQYNNDNKEAAFLSLKKSVLLEIIIFLSGLVLLCFFGQFLLTFALKTEIENQTLYLAIIIYIGVCIWQLAMLLHKPLELRMQTKHLAIGVLIAFLINIIANYFLIKHFQNVLVAGYTTIASSIIYIVYIRYFSLKKNV